MTARQQRKQERERRFLFDNRGLLRRCVDCTEEEPCYFHKKVKVMS